MEAIPHFELQKLCRICLKSDLLVSIFSPSFLVRPVDMGEKLNIFKFSPDDKLSSLLCQSCLYRLLDAYNLQQLAEASESRLHDYFNTTTQQQCISFNKSCNTTTLTAAISLDNPEFSPSANEKDDDEDDDDIYENICDMFDRNASNDIEVEDDVLNDVEIDVSSLTRSEAEDSVQDIVVMREKNGFPIELDNALELSNTVLESTTVTSIKKEHRKALKTPDKCEQCGKTFKYSGYLDAHIRTHTGEKPFQCKVCNKSFAQSSNLLLHNRIHTGERRYQCEICSRFFTTSSNLNAHKQTHLETRDYECAQCFRRFKSQREVTKHELVHRETKEAVCEICNKAFLKVSYLNIHMRSVHKGIRNHKCSECSKDFANKSNLICHMRTHTGEKPYQCKYCPAKFNQSSTLVRHSKQHLNRTTTMQFSSKSEEDGAASSHLIGSYISSNTEEIASHTNTPILLDFHQDQENIHELQHHRRISTNLDGSVNVAPPSLHRYDFAKETILDYSRQQTITGYDFNKEY